MFLSLNVCHGVQFKSTELCVPTVPIHFSGACIRCLFHQLSLEHASAWAISETSEIRMMDRMNQS
jgi:hypothetical protein